MQLSPFILAGLLVLPCLAQAADPVGLADVEKSLAVLNTNIDAATQAGKLSPTRAAGLEAQQRSLTERLAKVQAGGAVTPAEHDSLLAAVEAQEERLQADLPRQHPVDSAAIPNSGAGTATVLEGTSITTIGPNGQVTTSTGPVVNGVPTGQTITQPAFAQPTR